MINGKQIIKSAIKKIIVIICIVLIMFSNMTFYTDTIATTENESIEEQNIEKSAEDSNDEISEKTNETSNEESNDKLHKLVNEYSSNESENDNPNYEEIKEDTNILVGKREEMTNFNWTQDMKTNIGTIAFQDSGRTVHMTGNKKYAGKNAIYIIPTNHQEQTLQFNYAVEFGDSFVSAGVLLNVKKSGNALTGYMLSFNNDDNYQSYARLWYNQANDNLGAIWKFRWELGTNASNDVTRTLVKGLNIPRTGSMTVTSTPGTIKIVGTSINETINVTGNDVGDGFGFFTNHYSHDCDLIGSFDLTACAFTTVDLIEQYLYVDPNGGTWER